MLRFMSRQGHKCFRVSEGSGVVFPAERTLAGTDNLLLWLPFAPKFYSDRSTMTASAVLHHAAPALGHPNNKCCVIMLRNFVAIRASRTQFPPPSLRAVSAVSATVAAWARAGIWAALTRQRAIGSRQTVRLEFVGPDADDWSRSRDVIKAGGIFAHTADRGGIRPTLLKRIASRRLALLGHPHR